MERILFLLGGLLALVVVIAITVTNYEVGRRNSKAPPAILALDAAQVDRIVITGAEREEIALQRRDGGWTLPGLAGFPADREKVGDMLAHLLAIREDFPVEAEPGELSGFKVAENDFERRITLAGGGKTLATLYLGTPEGPRQSHARRADQEKVYAVAFGLFEAPVTQADWIDKDLLQLPQEDIAAIQVNGLHLVAAIAGSGDSPWQLDGAGPQDSLDPAAAARLAGRLAGLRIDAVLGREPEAGDGLDAPQLRLSVNLRDGSRIDYRLGYGATTGLYTLKVSSRPEYFRLSGYQAHQLIETSRREVLLAPPNRHAAAAQIQ